MARHEQKDVRKPVRRDVLWPWLFSAIMGLGAAFVITGNQALLVLSAVGMIAMAFDIGRTMGRQDRRSDDTRTP